MIEWIKFKGSTEEERIKEMQFPALLSGNSNKMIGYAHTPECFENNYTHWCFANLPEKEKWERKYQYADDRFKEEFDNIYEKLNELRKKIGGI